jgi:phage terminase small subunit
MPALKNPRHERMAQELARGTYATDAHEKAGFKRNDSNASKMASRPDIRARVTEITLRSVERTEISIASVLTELAKLGFSNMGDYVTVGADGLPFVDMSKVDRDKMAAVQEVHVETASRMATNEEGEREAVPVRKVRFKLADKRAALVDLGKHLGMFRDQVDVTVAGAVRFVIEGAPGDKPMKTIEAIAEPGEAA